MNMDEYGSDTEDVNDEDNTDCTGDGLGSFEEWTDNLAMSIDNPMTYGEFREAELDPHHPLRAPDNPRHEEYLRAKEQMEEMMKNLVPLESEVLTSQLGIDTSKLIQDSKIANVEQSLANQVGSAVSKNLGILDIPNVSDALKGSTGIDTRKYLDAFNTPYAELARKGQMAHDASKLLNNFKVSEVFDAAQAPLKDNAVLDSVDWLEQIRNFSYGKTDGEGDDQSADVASSLREHVAASQEALDRQIASIHEARARKEEEEQQFRERLVFSMNRLAELHVESAAVNEENRQHDLCARSQRDKEEKSRFWWTLWVGILTLVATITGLVVTIVLVLG